MNLEDLIEKYHIEKHMLDQCNIEIKYICVSRKTVLEAMWEHNHFSPLQSSRCKEQYYTFCGVRVIQVLEDDHFSISI